MIFNPKIFSKFCEKNCEILPKLNLHLCPHEALIKKNFDLNCKCCINCTNDCYQQVLNKNLLYEKY